MTLSDKEAIEKYSRVIQGLQSKYSLFVDKLDELKSTEKYKSNKSNEDARLSFYLLTINYLDAAIHLLSFNTLHATRIEELPRYYSHFNIKIPRSKIFDRMIPFRSIRVNNCQFIANQFSISVYSAFESSLRNIMRAVNCWFFVDNESNIICLLDRLMSESKNHKKYLEDYRGYFIAFNKIRNSIHNNGVHWIYSKNQKNEKNSKLFVEILEGEHTVFELGQLIKGGDPWEVHTKMTEILLKIHNDMIEIPRVEKPLFIYDPSF
ncbi:MAG: hypothetical protein AB7V56_08645 [Candidatus Nitrosocosmicus sp.]